MAPQLSSGSLVIAPTAKLEVDGVTHVGRVRERNEDQYLIASMQRKMHVVAGSVEHQPEAWMPNSAEGTVMIVADGMGGTDGGGTASAVAVRAVADYVCNVMPWIDTTAQRSESSRTTLPGVRSGLTSALVEGDAKVRKEADRVGSSDMGTTVTLAYVLWPHLYVAHAGDSRCYLMRDGRMTQLTTDHTMAEKLRQRTNMILDESSPWHHILWNALGGGEHSVTEPEVHRHQLQFGDMLLVCSDGLNKHVSDEEITAHLNHPDWRAKDVCQTLLELTNSRGGSDNTTIIVARCKPNTYLSDFEADEAPTIVS